MRRLSSVALLGTLLFFGCGGGSPSSPSGSGSVQFRLDQNSCTPALGTTPITITFFVDGSQIGTSTITSGQLSSAFLVPAGTHVASARVANTSVVWTNLNITITAGTTFTVVLTC